MRKAEYLPNAKLQSSGSPARYSELARYALRSLWLRSGPTAGLLTLLHTPGVCRDGSQPYVLFSTAAEPAIRSTDLIKRVRLGLQEETGTHDRR